MSQNIPFISIAFPHGAPPLRTREEQLQYDLGVAMQRLRVMESQATGFATILSNDGKFVQLANGGQNLEIEAPQGMADLDVGAVVRIRNNESKVGIVGVVKKAPLSFGPVRRIRRVVDDSFVEIDAEQGTVMLVAYSAKTVGVRPKVGDRIVLAVGGASVGRNLGQIDDKHNVERPTGVSWDDIGGQDEAKRALREAIEEPIQHKDIYEFFGKKSARGVLLHGPPGTGKTMLGKAAATAMAALHGKTATASGFQYVPAPELLNKFVGASEANIRGLFSSARAHFEAHGYPCLLFIDEADAVMGTRGATRGIEGMERTMVPQFLTALDGIEDTGAFVILATNRLDTLDPAVIRDGRMDRKIEVKRPTVEDTAAIFQRHLRDRPLFGWKVEEACKVSAEMLHDDKHALCMLRMKAGDRRFSLCHVVNGAMVAGIVERATQRAIRRAVVKEKPRGITSDDVASALKEVLEENRDIDHIHTIRSYITDNKLTDVTVEKVRS